MAEKQGTRPAGVRRGGSRAQSIRGAGGLGMLSRGPGLRTTSQPMQSAKRAQRFERNIEEMAALRAQQAQQDLGEGRLEVEEGRVAETIRANKANEALGQAKLEAEKGFREGELGIRKEELGIRKEDLGIRKEDLGIRKRGQEFAEKTAAESAAESKRRFGQEFGLRTKAQQLQEKTEAAKLGLMERGQNQQSLQAQEAARGRSAANRRKDMSDIDSSRTKRIAELSDYAREKGLSRKELKDLIEKDPAMMSYDRRVKALNPHLPKTSKGKSGVYGKPIPSKKKFKKEDIDKMSELFVSGAK